VRQNNLNIRDREKLVLEICFFVSIVIASVSVLEVPIVLGEAVAGGRKIYTRVSGDFYVNSFRQQPSTVLGGTSRGKYESTIGGYFKR